MLKRELWNKVLVLSFFRFSEAHTLFVLSQPLADGDYEQLKMTKFNFKTKAAVIILSISIHVLGLPPSCLGR